MFIFSKYDIIEINANNEIIIVLIISCPIQFIWLFKETVKRKSPQAKILQYVFGSWLPYTSWVLSNGRFSDCELSVLKKN